MLDELSIRIADNRDVETLANSNIVLAWETEKIELSLPVVTKGVKTLLASPQYGFYVVAEIDKKIVGCVMVTFEWSDWRCGVFWWLQSIYVEPEFRQKGIFTKLYGFLKEKVAKEPNVCGFRLYAEQYNSVAQNTYCKVGMKEAGYKVYQECFPPTKPHQKMP